MTRITPNQFKAAFLKAVEAEAIKSELVALWGKKTPYTTLMLVKVFPQIAHELGIYVYAGNYYHLDSDASPM